MPISCVYCGGSHPDSRGVRACWERSQGAEVGIDAPLPFDPGEHRKVAVKIVDDRGIESLKVIALS